MSNSMSAPLAIRWQLLSTVSALALLTSGYAANEAKAADSDADRPMIWIELGGQAENIDGQGAPFKPPFLSATPTPPSLPPIAGASDGPAPTLSVLRQGTTPTQAQEPPLFSFGEDAKVSFQPKDSDWIFSAGIRIGRSSMFHHVDHQTKGQYYVEYKYGKVPASQAGQPRVGENFADTQAHHKESHSILDFTAGKDVGLGMFGLDGSSTVSLGVRFAQFASKSKFDIRAKPDMQFKYQTLGVVGHPSVEFKFPVFHTYHATGQASRNFHGVGPSLSWNGSAPFVGNQQDGELTFDWGANAVLLFGRQKARVRHQESAHYKSRRANTLSELYYTSVYHHPSSGHPAYGHDSDRSVTVPNVGGSVGLSWRAEDFKISFGYRADFFFGAMDVGIDAQKSGTLGFKGPFASISVGLGD